MFSLVALNCSLLGKMPPFCTDVWAACIPPACVSLSLNLGVNKQKHAHTHTHTHTQMNHTAAQIQQVREKSRQTQWITAGAGSSLPCTYETCPVPSVRARPSVRVPTHEWQSLTEEPDGRSCTERKHARNNREDDSLFMRHESRHHCRRRLGDNPNTHSFSEPPPSHLKELCKGRFSRIKKKKKKERKKEREKRKTGVGLRNAELLEHRGEVWVCEHYEAERWI